MLGQQKQRFSIVCSTSIASSFTGTQNGNLNFNVNFKLFLSQEQLQRPYKVYTRLCTDESTGALLAPGELVHLSVNVGTGSVIQQNTNYTNVCGVLETNATAAIVCDPNTNPPFYVRSLIDANSINVKLLLSDLSTLFNANKYTLILYFEEV